MDDFLHRKNTVWLSHCVLAVFFQSTLERQPNSQSCTSDCNSQYENQFASITIAILMAFASKWEHKAVWQCFKSLRLQLLHSEAWNVCLGNKFCLTLILRFAAFNNKWHSLVQFQCYLLERSYFLVLGHDDFVLALSIV